VVETAGDCYARCSVRIRELYQSIDLIKQAAGQMEAGPLEVKVSGTPKGEFFARTEQPRGEVVYYAKADGTRFFTAAEGKDPDFREYPALVKVIPGHALADVPILVLTIDPCISCTER
jgi:ech hydrogenase subunit E